MPKPLTLLFSVGGAGLRLKEVTEDEPKAVPRIGNRPFLEFLLNQCGGTVASA
jgi:NDP-sugar pyrophosphorylase family protein